MGKPKGKTAKEGRSLSREDRECLRLQTNFVGEERSHLSNTGRDQGRVLRSRSIPLNQPQSPHSTLEKNGPQIPEPPPPPLLVASSPSNPTEKVPSRDADTQFNPGICGKAHPLVAMKVKPLVLPQKSSLTPPSRQVVS